MNQFQRPCLAAGLCLLFAIPAFSQQADLSGNWTLVQKVSLSGIDYVNSIANQVNVKQSGGSIRIERITKIPGQDDHTSIETLTTDGKTNVLNLDSASRKTATLLLASDGKGFRESGIYTDPTQSDKVKYKITEAWSLSADGATLTIVKNFENPNDVNDKWSVKGEYNKQ